MYYLYAKFDDCTFSRFGFIVPTDTQTHTKRITNVDKRLKEAEFVFVRSSLSSDALRRGSHSF